MFEVEVKARIHSSYQDLLVRLETLGADQAKVVHQVDTLYLSRGLTSGDIVWGMPVIRIRDQDGTIFFCVKKSPIVNQLRQSMKLLFGMELSLVRSLKLLTMRLF